VIIDGLLLGSTSRSNVTLWIRPDNLGLAAVPAVVRSTGASSQVV
jgi:hypothetical protein